MIAIRPSRASRFINLCCINDSNRQTIVLELQINPLRHAARASNPPIFPSFLKGQSHSWRQFGEKGQVLTILRSGGKQSVGYDAQKVMIVPSQALVGPGRICDGILVAFHEERWMSFCKKRYGRRRN